MGSGSSGDQSLNSLLMISSANGDDVTQDKMQLTGNSSKNGVTIECFKSVTLLSKVCLWAVFPY